jgi:hypothetical protein
MMKINTDALKDTLKILGGVIKDTLDMGDYRITLIIERKVDDKSGIIIEDIVVEKKLSESQIETIIQRFEDVINKI